MGVQFLIITDKWNDTQVFPQASAPTGSGIYRSI